MSCFSWLYAMGKSPWKETVPFPSFCYGFLCSQKNSKDRKYEVVWSSQFPGYFLETLVIFCLLSSCFWQLCAPSTVHEAEFEHHGSKGWRHPCWPVKFASRHRRNGLLERCRRSSFWGLREHLLILKRLKALQCLAFHFNSVTFLSLSFCKGFFSNNV